MAGSEVDKVSGGTQGPKGAEERKTDLVAARLWLLQSVEEKHGRTFAALRHAAPRHKKVCGSESLVASVGINLPPSDSSLSSFPPL